MELFAFAGSLASACGSIDTTLNSIGSLQTIENKINFLMCYKKSFPIAREEIRRLLLRLQKRIK